MAEEVSKLLLNSDLTEENERASLDYIQIDADVSEANPISHPDTEEELSDDRILQLIEQFGCEFNEGYPTSDLPWCMGSLHQAMVQSLYEPENARPLLVFVYDAKSPSTKGFCEQVLSTGELKNYITDNFIIWAWDRTEDVNYQQLLKMLRTHLGNEVEEIVTSSPIDAHPVLICLMHNDGQVEVTKIIQGSASNNDTLDTLKQARDLFENRFENRDPIDYHLKPVSKEGWSLSPSELKPIETDSEEFDKVKSQFVGQTERAMQIDKIENSSWLFQYLNQKTIVSNHCNDDQIEQLLIFPCTTAVAQHIIHNGFNDEHKCIADNRYGHGFYFFTPAVYKKRYSSSYSMTRGQKTMLVCRVLIGRTCLGKKSMETCPSEWDSTTDGSEIYVVYSNRSILPTYYIQY